MNVNTKMDEEDRTEVKARTVLVWFFLMICLTYVVYFIFYHKILSPDQYKGSAEGDMGEAYYLYFTVFLWSLLIGLIFLNEILTWLSDWVSNRVLDYNFFHHTRR
jgi:drug/metabolite transporter (DMT)-like permease